MASVRLYQILDMHGIFKMSSSAGATHSWETGALAARKPILACCFRHIFLLTSLHFSIHQCGLTARMTGQAMGRCLLLGR
jgi:hypothetical protein